MEKEKSAKSLGSVLDGLLCDRGWQYRLSINRVFLFWDEIVGNKIGCVARPEVVKGDVLWVLVPDSMWMQQLHLQKINILEKLNKRLGEDSKNLTGFSKIPTIQDIRFKIGQTELAGNTKATDSKEQFAVVDPQREHDFDMLTRSIKDDALRERFKLLWLGQEKRFIDRS